jgi:hypothetical protein
MIETMPIDKKDWNKEGVPVQLQRAVHILNKMSSAGPVSSAVFVSTRAVINALFIEKTAYFQVEALLWHPSGSVEHGIRKHVVKPDSEFKGVEG